MKKIIIDLETTNKSVFKAKILEICVLFVENNKITNQYHAKIRFEHNYDDCDKTTIGSLNFNKIYSQADIDSHNSNSISEEIMLKEMLVKIERFGKTAITGWNNASYDNIILRRIMEEHNLEFENYFDYHSRDIYSHFQPIFERIFKNKFRQTLSETHKCLFPCKMKDELFHHADYDCSATLDIDIWIENYFLMLNPKTKQE